MPALPWIFLAVADSDAFLFIAGLFALVIVIVGIPVMVSDWIRDPVRKKNRELRSPCQHYQIRVADSMITGTFYVRGEEPAGKPCRFCGQIVAFADIPARKYAGSIAALLSN